MRSGLTRQEIADLSESCGRKMTIQCVCPRVKSLLDDGLVEESGKRKYKSRVESFVVRITRKGLRKVTQ